MEDAKQYMPVFVGERDTDSPPRCADQNGCFRRAQMNMWETSHGMPYQVVVGGPKKWGQPPWEQWAKGQKLFKVGE